MNAATPNAATESPLVSIVMATYNRSHVIGHAIGSVRASTVSDWELIVVGDACTDDTADVVAGFGDPRIRFVNLERNHGEQSRPNNAGIALARGRYLAFLNHDDLWLPERLANGLDALAASGADLEFCLGLLVLPDGDGVALTGATTLSGRYAPTLAVPASLWLMKRELADRIGPWNSAFDLRVAPSQDWLYRAHRGGAALLARAQLGAVVIQSGSRRGSYLARASPEHDDYARRIADPEFAANAWAGVHLRLADRRWPAYVGARAGEVGRMLGRRMLAALGVFPPFPKYWLTPRKGGFIRGLRRRRGLPAVPAIADGTRSDD